MFERLNPSLLMRLMCQCTALLLLVTVCGCVTGTGTQVLETRVHEQEQMLHELGKQLQASQEELANLRREAYTLRLHMLKEGDSPLLLPEQIHNMTRVANIRVSQIPPSENREEGTLVINLVPVDAMDHVVKVAGEIQLTLLDLTRSEGERKLDEWSFPTTASLQHWKEAASSTGFFFHLPFKRDADQSRLTLQARMATPDHSEFHASIEIHSAGTSDAVSPVEPTPKASGKPRQRERRDPLPLNDKPNLKPAPPSELPELPEPAPFPTETEQRTTKAQPVPRRPENAVMQAPTLQGPGEEPATSPTQLKPLDFPKQVVPEPEPIGASPEFTAVPAPKRITIPDLTPPVIRVLPDEKTKSATPIPKQGIQPVSQSKTVSPAANNQEATPDDDWEIDIRPGPSVPKNSDSDDFEIKIQPGTSAPQQQSKSSGFKIRIQPASHAPDFPVQND